MKTQVDLLRAIESKEFTRLGGNEIIKSDFRIICATNTNLEESVKQGLFREDLYYRLQVYTINIEPLRQRPEDIPELVQHFIRVYKAKMGKGVDGIAAEALDKLIKFPWQGNVRELENAVERAMVVTQDKILSEQDFLLNENNQVAGKPGNLSLQEMEKSHLLNVLEKHKWNISASAKVLGIDRVTIYQKLKKYGIERPRDENA